jgi:hypothetical protein
MRSPPLLRAFFLGAAYHVVCRGGGLNQYHGTAADAFQRALCSRFQPRLMPSVQHPRIDHRCGHVFAASQLLHDADIVAGFWPVRREALPKGMAALWRDDFCRTYSHFDGILPCLFVGMMPIWCTAALSYRAFARGKDILPAPLTACLGVFSFKRKRQRDRAKTFRQAFGALPSRYLA